MLARDFLLDSESSEHFVLQNLRRDCVVSSTLHLRIKPNLCVVKKLQEGSLRSQQSPTPWPCPPGCFLQGPAL